MSASSVKRGLTPKREREHHEYVSMLRRMIRRGGARIGQADEVDLADFLTLRVELEDAITEAVRGLRAQGHPWSYIGRAFGISRQAAQMRYGHVDQ